MKKTIFFLSFFFLLTLSNSVFSDTDSKKTLPFLLLLLTESTAWDHPADPSDHISLSGSEAGGPEVAMDDNDNAIIVWVQGDPSTTCGGRPCQSVFRAEYRNGVLSTPTRISPPGYMVYKGYPQVAMDNNGNAIIVWAQVRASSASCRNTYCTQIYKSEYRNGIWNDPANIDDYIHPFSIGAVYPQVAMGDDGSAVIVWDEAAINMMEYRKSSWSSQAIISPVGPEASYAYGPRVAMNDSGNAIIAWRQQTCDACNDQLFISEYRNSSWTHPEDTNDYHSFSQQHRIQFVPFGIDVAMDNGGNAIVASSYWTGTDRPIFISQYRKGNWTHPANAADFISPPSSLDPYASITDDPQVAMDDNGNAIVTWRQPGGVTGYAHIFKSEYRNGSWSYPAKVTEYISKGFSPFYSVMVTPQVAMDNNGNAIITWAMQHVVDGAYCIYKSEYRNGSWSHPASANDFFNPLRRGAYGPRVAMNNNDKALIVWSQGDDTTACEYNAPCNHVFMSVYP